MVKIIINYNAFLKGSLKEKLEKLDQIGKNNYKNYNAFLKGSLKEQLAGIGKIIINYNAFLKGSIKEQLAGIGKIIINYNAFLKGNIKEKFETFEGKLAGIGINNYKL